MTGKKLSIKCGYMTSTLTGICMKKSHEIYITSQSDEMRRIFYYKKP